MKYDELIFSCIECIKKFNPDIEGPDCWAEKFLQKNKDSHERMFIKQIFYGVLRYHDFLKIFTDKFFLLNPASTERKDDVLYRIFAYITIFRIEEIPVDDYKALILSQDSMKMNEFFTFLFNFDKLNEVLRPEWIQMYDFMFVDDKIIGGLKSSYDILSDFIGLIYSKANPGNIPKTTEVAVSKEEIDKKRTAKVTIPEPFNLTKVKPKKILEPIAIPTKVAIKEVPYDQFEKTNLKKLETEAKIRKDDIKEKTKEKYEKSKPFISEAEKRPTNLQKIQSEVMEQREKELQFDKKYCGPILDFSKVPAEIKYNETAILRENLILQKKKKDEEEALNKILIEKKDTKEYELWKKEMEEKDNIKKLEEIAKRKIMSDLAKTNTLELKQKKIVENRLNMAKHKEEEALKMEEKHRNMEEELEKKRKQAKEMEAERENITEAKEKIVQKKTEDYYTQMAAMAEKVEKVLVEKKIEDERRKEIIRQIRELEKIPIKRTKGFDPTETAGLGLLEELSLVELRERLEIQKKLHQDYIESKKEENRIKNEERVEKIIDKAKEISIARDKLKNTKEVERQAKKIERQTRKEMVEQIREKSLLEVKKKIEEKKNVYKKEEEEFEKKIREIKLKRQYLQQGKAVVEEKAYKQIEDGVERKINDRQNLDLFNQQELEAIKYKEIKKRYNSAKINLRNQQTMLKNYDTTMKKLITINDELEHDDHVYKRQMYNKEKKIHQTLMEKIKEKNHYSDKVYNDTILNNTSQMNSIIKARNYRKEAEESIKNDSIVNHTLKKGKSSMGSRSIQSAMNSRNTASKNTMVKTASAGNAFTMSKNKSSSGLLDGVGNGTRTISIMEERCLSKCSHDNDSDMEVNPILLKIDMENK